MDEVLAMAVDRRRRLLALLILVLAGLASLATSYYPVPTATP
jgi:hypothetical protein